MYADITTYIAGIDFTTLQDQPQVVLQQPSESSLLQMLQEVSKNVKTIDVPKDAREQLFAPNKAVYQSDDGVEIFEVGGNDIPVSVDT